MLQFNSRAQLRRWLLERDVNTLQWGHGAAKTIEDLLAEIRKGESIMQNELPWRQVSAVRVVVRREEHILIEAAQGFNSGRRRMRGRPPSEKMYPGEHYAEAAVRCLREELGVPRDEIVLRHETYRRKVWEGDPISYPGLCTRYTFHIVDATVQGLPEESFSTREQAAGPGEPVNLHFWEWHRAGESD